MARTETLPVPEVGGEAPEFNLPSAQGGQLRSSMRTARGPVVVVFYEGLTEEEVAYFKDLASREDEINMAGGSVVGIGVSEPGAARELVRETGIKSYVLYDYARTATREYGLLEQDKKRGDHARPATFIVTGDHKVAHAWVGERPGAEEVLAGVTGLTGLPKEPEEEGDDKPKKAAPKTAGETEGETEGAGEAGKGEAGERKRLSPEEREKRRAERKAARGDGGEGDEKPAPEVEPEVEPEAEEKDEPGGATAEKPAEDAGNEAGDAPEGKPVGKPTNERAEE